MHPDTSERGIVLKMKLFCCNSSHFLLSIKTFYLVLPGFSYFSLSANLQKIKKQPICNVCVCLYVHEQQRMHVFRKD